ncbi:Hypothetical Protein NBC2815_02023 [Xanthomonas fragariae]|nr:Hypothetical Protein NBC2815_02023 [Xanthomonas fragariae]
MPREIEARGIGDVMAPVAVAEDFVGENGPDAAGLRRLMQLQMLCNRQISVTMGPVDFELRGEMANVRFTALLTGGRGGWPIGRRPVRSPLAGDCRAATGSCTTRNGRQPGDRVAFKTIERPSKVLRPGRTGG